MDFIKAIQDGDEWKLEVLGAPYGGPNDGKDLDGEFFTPNTDFMVSVGDKRPAVYFHGLDPKGHPMGKPEVLGEAIVSRVDEKGLWFDVVLDKTKKFAQRIWEAAKSNLARASTGAIYSMRRGKENGEITLWGVGELTLVDLGGGRAPRNAYAIARPMKATFDEAGIEMPEAFSEAEKAESAAEGVRPVEVKIEKENITMSEKEKEVAQPIDTKAVALDVVEILEAREEAKAKAKAEAEAEKSEIYEKALEKAREEIAGESKEKADKKASWDERKGAPAYNSITSLGFSDEQSKGMVRWLRTGDDGGVKAALQEGSDSEGGYLVPQEWGNQISEKLLEESFVRQLGCQVFKTSRYIVNLPVQGTELTTFVRTAEEGAYDEDEGDLESVQVTLHKWTKLMKISEELLSDNAFNVDNWLIGRLAAYKAWTENRYVINGTGTAQHDGVLTSGTAGLTFDCDTSVGVAEIPELLYKLPAQYRSRNSTAWVMHNSTEGYLRGLRDANNFAFGPSAGMVQGRRLNDLYGIPVYNQENTPEIAAATKIIVVGDFSYYALVDGAGDGGLTISRNPYLYQGNGQVGIFANFRQSGAVLQAEAFQYGTTKA